MRIDGVANDLSLILSVCLSTSIVANTRASSQLMRPSHDERSIRRLNWIRQTNKQNKNRQTKQTDKANRKTKQPYKQRICISNF